jgi:2-iminobutanoate/2-iminopropanoate deaminase
MHHNQLFPPSIRQLGELQMIELVNVGVASRIGAYSDAALIAPGATMLLISGTPGLDAESGAVPETFESQAELAWVNVVKILGTAGMSIQNIVKVTHHLLRRQDLAPYREIRSRHLGSHKPASMLTFLPELVWPNMLIELEIIAAK